MFVFDSDVPETSKLKQNIDMVRKLCPSKTVKLVFLVQVLNLEDELVRATNIKKISELTNSKSAKDFKSDRSVLMRHEFDILKMWNQPIPTLFSFVEQGRADVIIV